MGLQLLVTHIQVTIATLNSLSFYMREQSVNVDVFM